MPRLVVNGLALGLHGVGIGSFAGRALKLLATLEDWDVTVLTPEPGSRFYVGDLPAEQVRGCALPLGTFLGSIYWNQRIARHARERYPEAVYLCLGPSPAWRGPARRIVVMHDVIYRRFPAYLGRSGKRHVTTWLQERFAAKGAFTLTSSEYSAREIAALTRIPAERIRSAPLWIEDSFVAAAQAADMADLRTRLSLPERYWLYVGGFDARKNVDMLIQAYAACCAGGNCPPLLLAGRIPRGLRGPYCDVDGAIAAAGLPPGQIVCPGFIEDVDLPGLYAGADLFLYPSRMEGFGYPPAEALAAGTAVLCASGSSMAEWMPDATALLDPEDAGAWTAALQAHRNAPRAVPPFPDALTEQAARERLRALLTDA